MDIGLQGIYFHAFAWFAFDFKSPLSRLRLEPADGKRRGLSERSEFRSSPDAALRPKEGSGSGVSFCFPTLFWTSKIKWVAKWRKENLVKYINYYY
jgi:hypothetical protein